MSLTAGETYGLDFYRQNQKEHFQNFPGENTNANAGLLAGVQLCSHKVRTAGTIV